MEVSIWFWALLFGGCLSAALAWGVMRKTPISVVMPFFVGVCVGWVTHPVLWLVYWTPVSLFRNLAAQVELESAWVTNAVGDNTLTYSSYGLLQFQSYVWESLTGADLGDVWKSPYKQGIVGSAYLQDAILAKPSWVVWLSLPLFGPIALRTLWRGGADYSPFGVSVDGFNFMQELPILKQYAYWSLWTAPFSILMGWFLFKSVKSVTGAKKRRGR